MAEVQKLYICDRRKNEVCTKEGCTGKHKYCALTADSEYAVKGKDGQPLLYLVLDAETGKVLYESEERLDLWMN